MDIFIDAEDCIAGRLASLAAKELLKGRHVYIVNAEKAVISGDPKHTIRSVKEKVDRGDPYHGPFYPRRPDELLKRSVRGMLPKKPRGAEALKRLRVFISVPDELRGREFTRLEAARNRLKGKYIELGKVSERVGAKKTW
jgi:large subunit ribosomal protein L13